MTFVKVNGINKNKFIFRSMNMMAKVL